MLAVYKITCEPTGKIYIGKDSFFPRRFVEHKYHLRKGSHCNSYLQRAWNKYGEESFKFEKIQEASNREELALLELYWIELLNSHHKTIGYNQVVGLGSACMEKTEETKWKISKSLKGRKVPRDVVDKIARTQWKKLYQYLPDGTFIKEYPSVKSCCEENGFTSCTITENCRGKTRLVYGFKFSYEPLDEVVIRPVKTDYAKRKPLTRVSDGKHYRGTVEAMNDNNINHKKLMSLIESGEFI